MRNAGLDILRFIAVLLVLGRHISPCPQHESAILHRLTSIWRTGGWIGVDVFFVLSGFLVSGLLFREYTATSSLDLKRFLIRRGFKIYPAFWLLLVVTLLARISSSQQIPLRPLLGEVFFLQNYLGGFWWHTWSLAVEEHFYIGLALLFHVALKHRNLRNFSWVPKAFLALASVCLALRLLTWVVYPSFSFAKHVYGTHLRVDSLGFGVLLSFFYYCKPERFSPLRWHSSTLLAIGILFLLPAFFFALETHWFVSVFGVIFLYLGSGSLVIAALRVRSVSSALGRGLATLGAASYSIYLWHMPVEQWGWPFLRQATGLQVWSAYVVWYIVASCLFGYLLSVALEIPVLLLRNRVFPSRAVRDVVQR